MTSKEITEGNKLIAEFIGMETTKHPVLDIPCVSKTDACNRLGDFIGIMWDNEYDFIPIPLLFNESWDWLMPVVEKIWKSGYSMSMEANENDHYFYCAISFGKDNWLHNFQEMPIKGQIYDDGNMINTIYSGVIKFVKWYNENNK